MRDFLGATAGAVIRDDHRAVFEAMNPEPPRDDVIVGLVFRPYR